MVTPMPPLHDFSVVREIRGDGVPCLTHPEWIDAFPWLVQGITTGGDAESDPFDLGLFASESDRERAHPRWRSLREVTGADRVIHAPQVHGAEVRVHGPVPEGEAPTDPVLTEACDGHVTSTPGVLLTVTTADCVPVFVVDPGRRAVGALHAGWRGAAGGVLERGIEALGAAFGSSPADLEVHLGPAICGDCYEVGTEVFAALHQPVPDRATPIDLRRVLGDRAVAAGVNATSITMSAHCTLCTDSGLFSHRGGNGERQVGFIGTRS